MGRLSELSQEERELLFGRRSTSTFSFGRDAMLDFWSRAEREGELEYLDQRFPDEEPGIRGYRRRPVYLDDRDDWN